jgi:hypothetical protein
VEPIHENCIVAKQIFRYIRGMLNYGLRYTSKSDIKLHGFTNSDWVGSAYDINSSSGICFNLGSIMISWARRKHKSVTLNTAEVYCS